MSEQPEYNPDAEAEATHREREAISRSELQRLYDEAQKMSIPPHEFILDDPQASFDEMEEIYGAKRTAAFKEAIHSLTYADKDSFVEAAFDVVRPLIRDRLFDDEIRQRANEAVTRRRVEEMHIGNFKVTRMPSEWTCTLENGAEIKPGDPVLEIGWPEEGDADPPAGIQEVRASFRQIAAYLAEHPELKGVVAISWMMSHPLTDRLGFEKFPGIAVPKRQLQSILNMAGEARGDKYSRSVDEQDVQFGALSRDEFLERFGKNV